jgi:hypothetical protein
MKTRALVVGFSIACAGCATLMGKPLHLMPIASTPSEAEIVITDETGIPIFRGTTPTTVTLAKSNGSYWGKKSYVVKISKAGYEPQSIPVEASANLWYIGGNAIFGGLIGWFVIDPFNGGMYSLSPEAIESSLGANAPQPPLSHNNTAKNGSIAIMLIQDVPLELRGKMKRIN